MTGATMAAGAAAGGIRVQVKAVAINANATSPAHATSRLQMRNDGIQREVRNAATVDSNWILPASFAPGAYEVMATLNSGAVTAGSDATGAWLALTATRQWQCVTTGISNLAANLTIQVRIGVNILATGVVTLGAIES